MSPVAPERKTESPEWEAIRHAVECPLCEYNLRGLSERRCPECGFEFAWAEVLDPNRRNHPYLFEQHPERNFSSFSRTLVGGLRPGRFWTTLHPAQRPGLLRLGIYGAVVLLVAVSPVVVGILTLGRNWGYPGASRYEFPWRYLPVELNVVFAQFFYARLSRLLPVVVFAWTALPIVTYLLLMIFQATMRRVAVKMHHVVRCVVYSADVLVWPVVALNLLLVLNVTFSGQLSDPIAWLLIILFPLLWVVFTWRMMRAYRRYLRFNHAEMVVLSVQAMIGIALMSMMLKIRI